MVSVDTKIAKVDPAHCHQSWVGPEPYAKLTANGETTTGGGKRKADSQLQDD